MPSNSVTVYLKLNQITEVHEQDVFVKDVAEIYCSDQKIQNRCNAVKVKAIKDPRPYRYMLSALEVIRRLEEIDPSIQVNNVGEVDFIINFQPDTRVRYGWQWIKTFFVCMVCFCGAAFAIMTFNNDSSTADIFKELYLIVMGTESDGFTIMEVSYSIGLTIGILVFFNHFAAKKLTTDPTPLEVEMRLYEDSINKTLIQNNGRKESKIDVK